MIVKKELIGTRFSKVAPNGLEISGIISAEPSEFELYKTLELDVFESDENVTEIDLNKGGRINKK